jgi:hypothetical protein
MAVFISQYAGLVYNNPKMADEKKKSGPRCMECHKAMHKRVTIE